MSDFVIKPEYQGKGLASKLVKTLEEAIKENGQKYSIFFSCSVGSYIIGMRLSYQIIESFPYNKMKNYEVNERIKKVEGDY